MDIWHLIFIIGISGKPAQPVIEKTYISFEECKDNAHGEKRDKLIEDKYPGKSVTAWCVTTNQLKTLVGLNRFNY